MRATDGLVGTTSKLASLGRKEAGEMSDKLHWLFLLRHEGSGCIVILLQCLLSFFNSEVPCQLQLRWVDTEKVNNRRSLESVSVCII